MTTKNIRLTKEQDELLFGGRNWRRGLPELLSSLGLPESTTVELLEYNIKTTGVYHEPALIRATWEDNEDVS